MAVKKKGPYVKGPFFSAILKFFGNKPEVHRELFGPLLLHQHRIQF